MLNWFKMQAKGDTADIHIYDVISDSYGMGPKTFIAQLAAHKDAKEINVYLNSPGGEVFAGLAIHNQLKRHKAKVRVVVDGIAASIASIIAMAGDVVEMPANAMMMIHDPYGMAVGDADQVRAFAELLDALKSSAVTVYEQKTGQPRDKIDGWMAAETWFSADEAKEYGFADVITGKVAVSALAKFDLSNLANAPRNLIDLRELSLLLPPTSPIAGASGDVKTPEETGKVKNKQKGGPEMDKAELKEQHPSLYAQMELEMKAEGAQVERLRVFALEEAAPKGYETLLAECKVDPKATVETLALKVMAVTKAQASTALQELKDNASKPADVSSTPAIEGAQDFTKITNLLDRAKAEYEKNPKIRAEHDGHIAYYYSQMAVGGFN